MLCVSFHRKTEGTSIEPTHIVESKPSLRAVPDSNLDGHPGWKVTAKRARKSTQPAKNKKKNAPKNSGKRGRKRPNASDRSVAAKKPKPKKKDKKGKKRKRD